MPTLQENMRFLCDETKMLSSISVSYGTPDASETERYGRARETALTREGWIRCPENIDEESVYDLASLTKLFAAVMTMILVEQGRLDLAETIGEIDPRFVHMKSVSVFDTLCFRVSPQTPGRMDDGCGREEALRRLFEAVPGEMPAVRAYSDINAMIIKYIIEAKTGLPYFEALSHFILNPCGMRQTVSVVPPDMQKHCVSTNYEHRIAGGRYVLRTDILPGTPNDPKAAAVSLGGKDLCGHAGLFSTEGDMIRFAQALLSGELIRKESLVSIGTDYTGRNNGDGTYRQSLGFLCFSKHPQQVLSEVPEWMGCHAVGCSGFTGNHLSIDPEQERFVLFLGNRVHGRVSHITPQNGETLRRYGLDDEGIGRVPWPDGRLVPSSARYVHQKDKRLHAPVKARMQQLGWL